MKRAMFMVLWAIVFFIVTMIVGSVVLPLLCKIEGWKFPIMPLGVTMVWSVISIGNPLIALSLGSRGILPGTKKQHKDKQTHDA